MGDDDEVIRGDEMNPGFVFGETRQLRAHQDGCWRRTKQGEEALSLSRPKVLKIHINPHSYRTTAHTDGWRCGMYGRGKRARLSEPDVSMQYPRGISGEKADTPFPHSRWPSVTYYPHFASVPFCTVWSPNVQ